MQAQNKAMNNFARSKKHLLKSIWNRTKYLFDHYKWLITKGMRSLGRNILYVFRVFKAESELRSQRGRRFLELHYLLRDFLSSRVRSDTENSNHIASQLLNVLNRCDEITYEEQGTAEAYALIHFLDRYHRFQIIFDTLYANKIMPIKTRKIDILDIGTGPGPSMYAISDFYTSLHEVSSTQRSAKDNDVFSIDYVERSREFRNWLHHFTEHVNYYCPTKKPWKVPFHHGTFDEFKGLKFNRHETYYDQDDDGELITRSYIEKYRFDVVIFSNFLTTKEQVVSYSNEIKDCVRFLRNKGILIVVGATSSKSKYSEVYDEISKAILSENYSNGKFIAKCEKVDFTGSIMGYSWGDCYGKKLKELLKEIYQTLQVSSQSSIPPEMVKRLNLTLEPGYSSRIEWEVHVFRKSARPRRKINKNSRSK